MPWFIIYTRSRNEKKVEKLLIEKGIEAFCPTLIKKKKWSDRIKIVEEPLFRSYCFVNIEEHKRDLVYSVPGFSRFLFWLKRPAIIKDKEIEAIKQILTQYEHEQISLVNLQKDDKLEIESGIFENQQGKVISKKGNKLKLYLEEIGMVIEINSENTIYKKIK